jgi:hypothetical protein
VVVENNKRQVSTGDGHRSSLKYPRGIIVRHCSQRSANTEQRGHHSPAARYAKRINSTSEAKARTIPAISKWFSDSRNTTTPIVVSSRIMETE